MQTILQKIREELDKQESSAREHKALVYVKSAYEELKALVHGLNAGAINISEPAKLKGDEAQLSCTVLTWEGFEWLSGIYVINVGQPGCTAVRFHNDEITTIDFQMSLDPDSGAVYVASGPDQPLIKGAGSNGVACIADLASAILVAHRNTNTARQWKAACIKLGYELGVQNAEQFHLEKPEEAMQMLRRQILWNAEAAKLERNEAPRNRAEE